jgi:hypothetical protein
MSREENEEQQYAQRQKSIAERPCEKCFYCCVPTDFCIPCIQSIFKPYFTTKEYNKRNVLTD